MPINRIPLLVVGSFQRCQAYNPNPKVDTLIPVKIENLSHGRVAMCSQKLMTKAVEQQTINRPPMISPHRMLLSSMKAPST